MADHPYNPECGCPGCQFLRAAESVYQKFGPPSIIGTFEPAVGDYGRDRDHPDSMYRVWTGEYWWPRFEITPRQTDS